MMAPQHSKGAVIVAGALLGLTACSSGTTMNATKLKEFATRYTAAWCSQNPASVAALEPR